MDLQQPDLRHRILTPSGSRLRPFPKAYAIALAIAVLPTIPTAPNDNTASLVIHIVAKAVAVLSACAIASWAEQRVFVGLVGSKGPARLFFSALFVVVTLFFVLPVTATAGYVVGDLILQDNQTLIAAMVFGSLWMASAAGGSLIMVIIDVVISSLVPDFRSRVQAAVFALTAIAIGFALSVWASAEEIDDGLRALEIKDDMKLQFTSDEVLNAGQIREMIDSGALTQAVTITLAVVMVALSLPAILSACGKLADAVMARLNPLHEALREVSDGKLDVRVEVGGSVDFIRISEGFNTMADNLGTTLSDLEQTNQATRQFVPFQFLELLDKKTIVDIQRGDQIQLDISVMFSDIRDFTTLSEEMGPAATFGFINRYLAHMEPSIVDNQGFINEFLGDGIMALFHTGADAALDAALGMLERLESFNAELIAEEKAPIAIGIGMNSGPLMLGTIGGARRLSCTVIGDPANVAARVEGMTKLYGASLLISQQTRERLSDADRYLLREVDLVRAKGKLKPIKIFQVMDAESDDVKERYAQTRDGFAEAMTQYRAAEFQQAARGFSACAKIWPEDKATMLYLERCALRMARPDPHWDGITSLLSK